MASALFLKIPIKEVQSAGISAFLEDLNEPLKEIRVADVVFGTLPKA